MYVTVLEDDGSSLAASLTAAGLALADAAVQMFDTLVGASIVSCLHAKFAKQLKAVFLAEKGQPESYSRSYQIRRELG